LNNYKNLKNKEAYLLIFLFLFSFLIRIPSIFIFGDTSLENEWKLLVNYLTEYRKLYSILPSLINSSSLPPVTFDDFFVPNVFMPPLYAFYLYFFKLFNFTKEIFILIILFSQSILSSLSVVIFYIINKNFFSNKISLLGALIFLLFPIHIYACGQISSAILQSFLLVVFFYFFFKTIKKDNFFNICFLSLTSGLLILLRGEFIAYFILSILYMGLFLKINLKSITIIVLLTTVAISPYLIRNIMLVDTITITKSIGYNLWKGNNPNSTVEGNSSIDSNMIEQIEKLPKDKYFDVNADRVFQNEGLKNIKNNPLRYLALYVKKILSFIFIDINSSYPKYYHPLHYLPILLIGITSILGIILSNKNSKQINFLILYFIANITIISVFFVLPRYSLAILPLQIIFSNIFFQYIKNNFFKT
jgi:4-amino-4-deoxy-L-arabinose transferase-like glycosyltransferase